MSKYRLVPASVRAVVATTQGAIDGYAAPKKSITEALTEAGAALPAQYSAAVSALQTISADHARDIDNVVTYAKACAESVNACMSIYDHASVDMMVETRKGEKAIAFDTAFGGGAIDKAIKSKVGSNETLKGANDSMPKREEQRYKTSSSYEKSTSDDASGTTTTTTTKSSKTVEGVGSSSELKNQDFSNGAGVSSNTATTTSKTWDNTGQEPVKTENTSTVTHGEAP